MSKQKILQLKRQAHKLKPVVMIGAQGLTTRVLQEIDAALTAHELIKVRINANDREQRLAMLNEILEKQHAILIQAIGHVVAIYRQKPKDA